MLEPLQTLTLPELCFRVGLAALLGFLIGLDRDFKNKPIDFRAYMIVCIATCLVAVLGQELYETYDVEDNFVRLDLGKIISGVLTGIGFLGAGAILRDTDDKNQIIGTSTGASIWGASIIGLCIGFGYITLAIVGFVSIFTILLGVGYCRRLISGKKDKEKA
jgi:putative Mg2+ transporter-C (MgtC) family protein